MGFIICFIKEILKRSGEFCLQDYNYYIKSKVEVILLLDSKNIKHKTIGL